MFPVLVDEPPEGGEWHHEAKYDGYRTQIVIREDGVRAYTRNRHDWTDRYGPVVEAAAPCAVDRPCLTARCASRTKPA